MPKAILKNGVIYPLEPLPADWQEGMEVVVDMPADSGQGRQQASRSDEWMDRVEALARLIPPEADAQLEDAIAQIRSQAKQIPPRSVRLE